MPATVCARAQVVQCATCPWRVDCDPEEDIVGYSEELHKRLTRTLASGPESIFTEAARQAMACHKSTPGAEFPCAGWLQNQLGPGNNIGLRIAVSAGRMPAPVVHGEQHERFEDTLPKKDAKKMTKPATKKRIDLEQLAPEQRDKIERVLQPRDTVLGTRHNAARIEAWKRAAAKASGGKKSFRDWVEEALDAHAKR
jgi:hypothetical protein